MAGLVVTDELASQQLAALARVDEAFERAGIEYWLFGGWAVDFYAGSVTRRHDDLDVAVWLDDLPRIAELLQADGWRHAPHDDEDGGTGYERESVRLEFTFLTRDADGSISTPLRAGRIRWDRDAFANDVRRLRGVAARLISLAALRGGKAVVREDAAEGAKDRADYERLAGLATSAQ